MTSITPPMSPLAALNGVANADSVDSSQQALENDLLVSALHTTQEQLERTTIELCEKNLTIEKMTSKLNRLLAKFPDYWEAESIDYSISEDNNGVRKIIWSVSDTELGNNYYKYLQFETALSGGVTGIKILNTSQGLDFFKFNTRAKYLNCLPVNGAYSAENNKCISSIGTSDWKAIKDLASKLRAALINNEFPEIPNDFNTDVASGLNRLKHVFDHWPNIPRYDAIELKESVHTDEYQALDISISNLEVDSSLIASFTYRISSVNEPGKHFGQFPRLEFGESTTNCFDNWFKETSDHRGNRLELRFADPDQMDIGVWKKLSQRDQLLIVANISILPEALKKLKDQGNIGLDLDAWEKLSAKVKKILASTVKSQEPRIAKTSN
ncbi:hypothetical protein [Pseudomonas sp. 51_B]|uniref:hypothetical protein n=1 Tax=Pseudomonas sp. 51_B TaxID=2813573 RepID=UPI001A9F4993|nr:hypothetical protein [Pseudomonas sp. 51_B]